MTTKQSTEAERLIEAYDDYIFGALGRSIPEFDRVASVMAFNAAEAAREAAKSYSFQTVDYHYWMRQAANMQCFVY